MEMVQPHLASAGGGMSLPYENMNDRCSYIHTLSSCEISDLNNLNGIPSESSPVARAKIKI